jgi:hypothetical protein
MTQKDIAGLSGLELAEFILKRLTEDGYTTEKLTQEFDGNEKYVLSLLDFLKDIRWMKEEPSGSGKYVITDKAKSELQKFHS